MKTPDSTENPTPERPLSGAGGSALDLIEAHVGDLGDSEAARCIREVCRELRAARDLIPRAFMRGYNSGVGAGIAAADRPGKQAQNWKSAWLRYRAGLTPNAKLSHG